MKINTSRILWGVQRQMASDGSQCVADWYTDYAEAEAARAAQARLVGVYQNVELVYVTLPDAYKEPSITRFADLVKRDYQP